LNKEELKYQIAITLLEGIGAISAKKLIAYCGGAEAVFKEKKAALLKIPSIGQVAAKPLQSHLFSMKLNKKLNSFKKQHNLTFLSEQYLSTTIIAL